MRTRGIFAYSDAEAGIVLGVQARAEFRFRDTITVSTTQTNPVKIAVLISMDGNLSKPDQGVGQQIAYSTVRTMLQDVTGRTYIDVAHESIMSGPDYKPTFLVDVVVRPNGNLNPILRLDVRVDISSPVQRFAVGTLGGTSFADYLQCINGNSVCFENCEEEELGNCSGFSIRMHVVPPAAASGTLAAAAAPTRLISAAGYDYSAPIPTFKPTLRVRQAQDQVVVEWPSTANDWLIAGSTALTGWSVITNKPSFDYDQMMFQLPWPRTNAQQFFRLQKP